jgi:hypothetical protein
MKQTARHRKQIVPRAQVSRVKGEQARSFAPHPIKGGAFEIHLLALGVKGAVGAV